MVKVRRKVSKRGRIDDKIVIHKIEVGETTSYVASYGNLQFEGETEGEEVDVREVLRRMLGAHRDPPEGVRSLVPIVVAYIELMTKMGVKYVTTSAGVKLPEGDMLSARVNAYYADEKDGGEDDAYEGWIVWLKAVFEGFDGYSYDASHEISKTWRPGKNIDYNSLRDELASLIRKAYNAHR
jgi:hypothetical protein